ncbi:MAG: hypothetical protein EZS28_018478 [Streblomastix strix]|uniref:Trichohyalin-plectin-homology domain-containing protein n=1 Tax=Streblomastix strix TaxID=222440 RepID=A0A5J4VU94_9EUKA|nr:MAG: hypothetical protein EZS28_018478 [Streblomastix strix]
MSKKTAKKTAKKPIPPGRAGDEVLIAQSEYQRMWKIAMPPPEDRSEEIRKREIHERSVARARGWSDSLESKLAKKKQDKEDKIRKHDDELAAIDEQESQYQQMVHDQYLDRANAKLRGNSEEARLLAQKLQLAEVMKEREKQIQIAHSLDGKEKTLDGLYYSQMIKKIEDETKRDIEIAERQARDAREVDEFRMDQKQMKTQLKMNEFDEDFLEGQRIKAKQEADVAAENEKQRLIRQTNYETKRQNDIIGLESKRLKLEREALDIEEDARIVEQQRKQEENEMEARRREDEARRLKYFKIGGITEQMVNKDRELRDAKENAMIENALKKQEEEFQKQEQERKEKELRHIQLNDMSRKQQLELKQQKKQRAEIEKLKERENGEQLQKDLAYIEISENAKRRAKAEQVDEFRRNQRDTRNQREFATRTLEIQQERDFNDQNDGERDQLLKEELARAEAKGLDPTPILIGYHQLISKKIVKI